MNIIKKILSVEEIKIRLAPLFKDKELQIAFLFGSTASGRVHKQQSDIDLAFLFDKPIEILDLTNKVIRLLHLDYVDVVDLRRASPLLKFPQSKMENSFMNDHQVFSMSFSRLRLEDMWIPKNCVMLRQR